MCLLIVRIIFKSSVMMVIVDVATYLLQTITIVKAGGPLGLSIVGGADLICYPFGVDKPGTFVSKVRHIKVWQFVFVCFIVFNNGLLNFICCMQVLPDGAASKTNLRFGDRILRVSTEVLVHII